MGTNDYGTISIGATESCGGSILPHLIEGFHETAPHIRFQIWTGNSDETQERLEKIWWMSPWCANRLTWSSMTVFFES